MEGDGLKKNGTIGSYIWWNCLGRIRNLGLVSGSSRSMDFKRLETCSLFSLCLQFVDKDSSTELSFQGEGGEELGKNSIVEMGKG